MWELLIIGCALTAVGFTLSAMLKGIVGRIRWRRATQRFNQHAATARWRQAQAEAAKRLAARDMQLAMQQLSQSPDFRRAASYAAHAAQTGVPVEFRQRQFRRLRSLLVDHLASRLRAGASLECATAGVHELVSALGVARYEGDYIATEAQGRLVTTPAPVPDYCARLQQLHADHTQRLEAIRNTPDLENELREQLLEAEHERFRGELLQEPSEQR